MLITLGAGFVVLGVLVFIHELGHFMAAKGFGVAVDTFSIGFPPKAITLFRHAETEYILSWIPFGGYVQMKGENPEDERLTGANDELGSKNAWQRFIIFFAGVGMNFVLAFIVFFIINFWVGLVTYDTTIDIDPNSIADKAGLISGDRIIEIDGQTIIDWDDLERHLSPKLDQEVMLTVERDEKILTIPFQAGYNDSIKRYTLGFHPQMPPIADKIIHDSPAEKAGLQSGDRIVEIEGTPINRWRDLVDIIHRNPENPLNIVLERDDERISMTITPEAKPAPSPEDETKLIKEGRIGISPPLLTKTLPFGESIVTAGRQFVAVTVGIYRFLGMLVTGKVGAETIGGPILIFQAAGDSARQGLTSFLSLAALLSINLAILNLLPLPALDGWHILVLIVETVTRRPMSTQSKVFWQLIGFTSLILLMIFAMYNDIIRILPN